MTDDFTTDGGLHGEPPFVAASLFPGSATWPSVLEFAKRMEKKLAFNRHKGDRQGWINDDPEALLARLLEETKELDIEIRVARVRMHAPLNAARQAERVADEAADVANFAMMLADWHVTRKPGNDQAHPTAAKASAGGTENL